MKQRSKFSQCAAMAAAGFLLAAWPGTAQAQVPTTNIIAGQFDCDGCGTINTFAKWWGDPAYDQSWDGTQNAVTTLGPNTDNSGAHKFVVHWTQPNGNQLCLWQEVDGAQNYWVDPALRVNGFYYDLSFDIKFDPSSAVTVNGDFGHLQFGVSTPSWNQVWLRDFPNFNSNGWTHISCPIDPAVVGIDQITAFIIYYPWQPGAITGDQTFWVDNIIFQTNLNKNLKPPTLTLKPVTDKPGLNIVANGSGDYPREMIANTTGFPKQGWVGYGSAPVSYSFTLTDFPGTNHSGFQAHLFLVPNGGNDSAIDWNATNVVWLNVSLGTDGVGHGDFRYKTNGPGGNTMMFNDQPGGQYGTNGAGVGHLLSLACATGAVGTWTLTFDNDTNGTVTAPDGTVGTFTFPDAAAIQTLFPDPVTAYVGIQKNGAANAGQRGVFSKVQFTGTGNPLADTFPGPDINSSSPANAYWRVVDGTPADVFVISASDAWWLNWTLPDLNFSLESAPSLTGIWTDPKLTNTVVIGATRQVRVPKSAEPQSYFRMVKRTATKLQVLLPGETAAPGTLTGKTGTPTNPGLSSMFDVTVNAVDDTYHLVPTVTDSIQLSSTDTTAGFPPDPVPMVNGTYTFSTAAGNGFYFGSAGTWTITATDVTDGAKAPGVSTPVNAH